MTIFSSRSRLITATLAGVLILGAQGQSTLTFDNVRLWQDTATLTSQARGSTSEGVLIPRPGADLFQNGNTGLESYGVPLRIEGLNLDGDGGDNDYIDFTIQFDAARDGNPQVSLTGAGVGVSWDLSDGANEQLTVSVIVDDISAEGWATMDGFTAAQVYLGGSNITTNGQLDVNGITYTDGFEAVGFAFNIGDVLLPDQPNTVVLNNVVATDGDFRLRTTDFSITYDPDGVQPPPPPKLLKSNNLNLRPDTLFVYPNQSGPNKGGSNGGEIIAQPGFDATMVEVGPTTDFLLRWSELDLDGVGANDDYVDFTLRATAVDSEENVTFGGEGFGIAGGGSYGLDEDEQLKFEVVDFSVSPGTGSGTLAFDGFSGAGFFLSGNAGVDIPTTGSGQANVNGNTVMFSIENPEGGYANGTQEATFDLTDTVVFDTPLYTEGSVTPIGRARHFDLQFSFQLDPPAPTPLTIVAMNYADPQMTIVTTGVINGRTYHVQYSPDLETAFTAVPGSSADADDEEVFHIIDTDSDLSGFYRVVSGSAP